MWYIPPLCRKNTLQVSSGVEYFVPMTHEPLNCEETEAVSRFSGISVRTAATATRAIIQHQVYHSLLYKRRGNSCSSIVEILDENRTLYGRIVKFILLGSASVALLKIIHHHSQLNICKETPPPSRPFLRQLSRDGHLADYYHSAEELDELIAIKCSTIIRKCIYVECSDFHESVTGFIVPVLRDFQV